MCHLRVGVHKDIVFSLWSEYTVGQWFPNLLVDFVNLVYDLLCQNTRFDTFFSHVQGRTIESPFDSC